MGGHIYVPLALTKQFVAAQHSYAHPLTGKTHDMFRGRYQAGIKHNDLTEIISQVVASCPVCQTVKARKAVQPQSCHSYPIPEYPLTSVAMDFSDIWSHPVTPHI